MTPEEKEKLILERKSFSDKIINSTSAKKIIVAGPGTGKTFTFSKLFEAKKEGKFLALTFIRNLADSLAIELPGNVEARTFHSFCKRILHEQRGMISIFPSLSKIISYDATFLKPGLTGFVEKFQTLDEGSAEIDFFIERGDYYNWLSFEDAVYRLYKILQMDKTVLSEYDQIVIDEYQDFNALEVAFINELESKGPILIVGDDDQALYLSLKNATPNFIREKFNSGEYEKFELPFCSRCPEVIVNLTNSFIKKIKDGKRLQERIEKDYRSFLPDVEEVSSIYNKVKYVELSMISSINKYISCAIKKIPQAEITESYDKGYPTVLILGPPHYLDQINKGLAKKYSNIELRSSEPLKPLTVIDAYEILIGDIHSNLGWRILCEVTLGSIILTDLILKSAEGGDFESFLDNDFVEKHTKCIRFILDAKSKKITNDLVRVAISEILGPQTDNIIRHFLEEKDIKEIVVDRSQPKILLTTYVGCKGLSGGHVFITCFWDGEIPRISKVGGKPYVDDVEISKFIVALTRTRKECHLIYNKWMIQSRSIKGKYTTPNTRSCFRRLLSDDFIDDLGLLNSNGIEKLFA
jgi:superfamily I DNA/RNA helicase